MNVEALKSQHDIVQVIGATVALKKRGHRYFGICPFHADTNPSLVVYPKKQSFHCFGCSARGDVIDWIQKSVKVDFKTAIKLLGHLPEIEPQPLFKSQPKKFKTISIEVARHFHSNLKHRRDYYLKRGFTDKTIDAHLWGYTGRRYSLTIWAGEPQKSQLLAIKLRRDDEREKQVLRESGLSGGHLQNALGQIAKYILKGSYAPILYNAWRVQGRKIVFVYFGEFDCRLASQLGLPACSPVHGCESWDKSWGGTYLRHAKEIPLCPDRKERAAGFKVRSLLGGHARVLKWPEGDFDDFNDYILQGGTAESFLDLCREQNLTNLPNCAIIRVS